MKKPEVMYRNFRSMTKSWDDLMSDAAEFAAKAGPKRLISISHSDGGGDGLVTVWYWSEASGDE